MANLKNDIVNELRNEKYYLEQDLGRLWSEASSLGYRERIHGVKAVLSEIAVINQSLGLLEAYVPTQQVPQQEAPAPVDGVEGDIVSGDESEGDVVTGDEQTPAPASQPHQGQTHGE